MVGEPVKTKLDHCTINFPIRSFYDEEKDEQIQRLLRQMSEQGGHAAAVASFFGLRF